ncbi:MAG: hypothetical protein QOI35_3840, partial [Cryptosporangiaceae bacterium]|nr:hypothetical protein [Cryptosporangiaceae bacterium]
MSLRRDLVAAAALAVAVTSAGSPASAQAPAASEPGLRPAHFVLPKPTGPAFDPHTVLVKFKPGAGARSRALAAGKATVQRELPGAGFVKVTTTETAETALASLRKDPSVAAVSLDYRRHLTATPADPYYALSQQPYLSTLRLPQAWDVVRDATSQVIAVVDTGVYLTHTDLAARIVPGYNVLNPGTPPADSDPNNPSNTNAGHGTMVAGIAAAHSNNGRGIAGAAWASRIMPVKVFPASGGAVDSDIATGITWAADHGATIVNLSLGGPADDPVLHSAIQYATGKGALVVVAAGNEGSDRPQYPAAYPEVLAVGATDRTGSRTDFSSYGDWVDVAAPGFDITSTFPHWNLSGGMSTDYATGSGTSFAAPLVSGIAALVRAKLPSLSPAQVLARLKATARDAGPRGLDPYYGAGIVDAARAVGGSYGAEFPQPAMGPGEPNDVPARATLARSVTLGTFGAEGDVDWYHFDMTTTSAMTMTVRGPKADATRAQNADPVLELYDQDLHLLGRSDGLGVDATENIKGELSPGTFYIAVRNFNGAIDSRTYELEVAGYGVPSPAFVPGGEQEWIRDVAPADFSTGL